MLDVARETYKENVGDIHSLLSSLKSDCSLPLNLLFKERGGGFWLSLSEGDVDEGEFSTGRRGWLNVEKRKGRWTFTTLELVSLCDLFLW